MALSTVPQVSTYAIYTQKGQEKRAITYLKSLRKTYNSIIDAAAYPFKCYVRLDVSFQENGSLKDLKLDLPKEMKADIEGYAGIIKICGHGDKTVPVN